MPWDEPASAGAPVEAPDYDQVPYSDDDVAAVLDDSVEDAAPAPVAPAAPVVPAPAAPAAPAPQPAPTTAPAAPVAPASQPAPTPAPTPAAPAPEPEPAPAPKPAPAPASPEDIAARSALPPELNNVADMLEKVFGPAVSLSVEKKSDAGAPSDAGTSAPTGPANN